MLSHLPLLHVDPLFFDQLLDLNFCGGLWLLLEIAIQERSVDTRIQLVGVKRIAHAVSELVDKLSVVHLDLLFHEILHTVVLAEVLELGKFLLRCHDGIASFQLFLELLFSLPFLLKLLQFAEDRDFEVDRLHRFFLPLSHLWINLMEFLLEFILLLLMNAINQI